MDRESTSNGYMAQSFADAEWKARQAANAATDPAAKDALIKKSEQLRRTANYWADQHRLATGENFRG